jgi:hypothetical protein
MVRALAGSVARVCNTLVALLLTFTSLAIPPTANLYTPKLIEIFIRDRFNIIVLSMFAFLAAHNLFATAPSFDLWVAPIPAALATPGAVIGWLLPLPYDFYVPGFIDPLTVIKRVHPSLMLGLQEVARGRYPVREAQRHVNPRIVNLGSMLQRSADRADRDVAFDAIKAHTLDLACVRQVNPRLPEEFLRADNELMVGMSRGAVQMLKEQHIWMEQRIAGQRVMAFKVALTKMPEGVSALAHAVSHSAHEEARLGNEAVLQLMVRVFNSFTREPMKKGEYAFVHHVVYDDRSLVRRLMRGGPGAGPDRVCYLACYAEFARSHKPPFVYELIGDAVAELAEHAYAHQMPMAPDLLDAVLQFEGVEHSAGLVKGRAILARFLLADHLEPELERVQSSLREAFARALAAAGPPPAAAKSARARRGPAADARRPPAPAQDAATFAGLLMRTADVESCSDSLEFAQELHPCLTPWPDRDWSNGRMAGITEADRGAEARFRNVDAAARARGPCGPWTGVAVLPIGFAANGGAGRAACAPADRGPGDGTCFMFVAAPRLPGWAACAAAPLHGWQRPLQAPRARWGCLTGFLHAGA